MIPLSNRFVYFCLFMALFRGTGRADASSSLPPATVLADSWQMQDAALVPDTGAQLSQASFTAQRWYKATVPGTVLTTLVDNGVYPEPLYGENNRPDKIPESLCRKDWWYRASFPVPAAYAGRKIWLNFAGINYVAEVWVNGARVGAIKGAFTRGVFDVSSLVKPGQAAALAVRVSPQPHPGLPFEHTIANGLGSNGGLPTIDGPTFLCSVGWDWIPAIRDRNTGIWQKVTLSASGPVVLQDPSVTTDLAFPSLASADITIQAKIQNLTAQPQNAILKGSFGDVTFARSVQLGGSAVTVVSLDSRSLPQLHLINPKLWWPNGYGPQNLYTLRLSLEVGDMVSDVTDTMFGIRKITYGSSEKDNLTISVNGVRTFIKGGDWGLDEALKRIPRERLEAQIRMHQLANYNIIRNWVGQSTEADFYDLCDKYGILIWDEFFQPNPGDGPNAPDLQTYMANAREKVTRFRNHPSIALWCGRNEGRPPKEIDDALTKLTAELDPSRLYQPSSTSGRGVHSGGPYRWRVPREYYAFPDGEAFKTEIGSVSVPTWESIQGMMPEKDWTQINDDWAEHDLASGAQGGNGYPGMMAKRYGAIANAADFARKGQLMNYEAFRAMYEGREAKMFHFATGVITWMSNPAQPSFVWQIYSHDLEPNSALFAVRKACEPIHIQFNEQLGSVQVINNTPSSLNGAKARLKIFNMDGSSPFQKEYTVDAPASAETDLGIVSLPPTLSSVYFIKLQLVAADGALLSDNFYWQATAPHSDDLTAMAKLPLATLQARIARRDADGKTFLDVTLRNPAQTVAVAAHLQLHRATSGQRALPVYYSDNYVSLVPGEEKTIITEIATADLKGEKPLVLVDGWNVGVNPVDTSAASLALNENAQTSHWPASGLTIVQGRPRDNRQTDFRINCGGPSTDSFQADDFYSGGQPFSSGVPVSTGTLSVPQTVFQTGRSGDVQYLFYNRPQKIPVWYHVRLYFAENTFHEAGKRRFNVEINGHKVLEDFDIFREAAGPKKAVVKDFPLISSNKDGTFEIKLETGSAGEPEICGVELFKTKAPEPPKTQAKPSAAPGKKPKNTQS